MFLIPTHSLVGTITCVRNICTISFVEGRAPKGLIHPVGAAMTAVGGHGCYNAFAMAGTYHGEDTYVPHCAFVAAPRFRIQRNKGYSCRISNWGSRSRTTTVVLGQSQHSEQRAGFQPPSPLANDGHVVDLSSLQDLFDSGK